MSEFDRSETFRRSIRRPRKPLAPSPPTILPEKSQTMVSPLIKRLPVMRKAVLPSVLPVANTNLHASKIPVPDDDSSQTALQRIQQQINKIEFNTALQRNHIDFLEADLVEPLDGKRYNEMESLAGTGGLSDLKIDDSREFHRGETGRSSFQEVPSDHADAKKIKQFRPVGRTASDSKHVEMIRKHVKRKQEITNNKADEKKPSDQVKH